MARGSAEPARRVQRVITAREAEVVSPRSWSSSQRCGPYGTMHSRKSGSPPSGA